MKYLAQVPQSVGEKAGNLTNLNPWLSSLCHCVVAVRTFWGQVLGKLPNLSVPQCPHL